MSLNKILILGRLGQSVELKYTQSSKAVANFSVATSKSWKDKDGAKQEKTTWHRVVVWGKQAESCAQYLEKGSQVYVEGEIDNREWEGKDGTKRYTTEVNASTVQFLGSRTGQKDKPQDQFSGPSELDQSNYGDNNFGAARNEPVVASGPSFKVEPGPAFDSTDIPF